jgi:hypothetical protein
MMSQMMFEGTMSFMAANFRDALDAIEGCVAKDLKLLAQIESRTMQMQKRKDLAENFIFLPVTCREC